MDSDYAKIFSGNNLLGKRIATRLHETGIEAVVKDEAESARLAGFASAMLDQVDIYVNNDEVARAREIVDEVRKNTQQS
ncbi:DUF2007 domain-containing protein [Flavobacteriaceae bacterium TP-CH-4]|uniref:DUF2007 domain-containing protein n=1 Tax=Pelagihabitans pacificus TaxID=2696054 RepID=A0A967E506_9FLAO|nr:DUF2007 domain-containing protein [Pelagihabitans pacificus]NHF58050.1 DUF2007 domain-containing protein [Pelagihabitans pacificus]